MVLNYIYKNFISFFVSTEVELVEQDNAEQIKDVIENEPLNIITETLTPNAMAPLPKNKIIV
jgi:hypothetical protein|tara:strand:+ start:636 stop:821 length:186 start_codon:yes stop_codon:yes gene_type:complete